MHRTASGIECQDTLSGQRCDLYRTLLRRMMLLWGRWSELLYVAPSQIIMTRKEGVFDGVELFRWDFGALFAIPIIVFGFNCHANVRTFLFVGVHHGSHPTEIDVRVYAQMSGFFVTRLSLCKLELKSCVQPDILACSTQVVTIFYELDLMPKVLIAGLPEEPSAYQRVRAPESRRVPLPKGAAHTKGNVGCCSQGKMPTSLTPPDSLQR